MQLKSKVVFPVAMLLVFGLFFGNILFIGVEDRKFAAQGWSTTILEVRAIGALNETLLVTPRIPVEVSCQEFVDSVVADKNMAEKLSGHGFKYIQCGDVRGRLPQ
jgi:hypothetical protein